MFRRVEYIHRFFNSFSWKGNPIESHCIWIGFVQSHFYVLINTTDIKYIRIQAYDCLFSVTSVVSPEHLREIGQDSISTFLL